MYQFNQPKNYTAQSKPKLGVHSFKHKTHHHPPTGTSPDSFLPSLGYSSLGNHCDVHNHDGGEREDLHDHHQEDGVRLPGGVGPRLVLVTTIRADHSSGGVAGYLVLPAGRDVETTAANSNNTAYHTSIQIIA